MWDLAANIALGSHRGRTRLCHAPCIRHCHAHTNYYVVAEAAAAAAEEATSLRGTGS